MKCNSQYTSTEELFLGITHSIGAVLAVLFGSACHFWGFFSIWPDRSLCLLFPEIAYSVILWTPNL
jgi:hypothetical protein